MQKDKDDSEAHISPLCEPVKSLPHFMLSLYSLAIHL